GDDINGLGNAGSAYLFTTDRHPGSVCDGGPADPTPYVTAGTYFGCTGGENEGIGACGPTGWAVWDQFTAPCDGILSLSTCGTDDLYGVDTGIDTVLTVQTECPGPGAEILMCNDDASEGNYPDACTGGDAQQGLPYDAALRVGVSAGENYKIRVATYG